MENVSLELLHQASVREKVELENERKKNDDYNENVIIVTFTPCSGSCQN